MLIGKAWTVPKDESHSDDERDPPQGQVGIQHEPDAQNVRKRVLVLPPVVDDAGRVERSQVPHFASLDPCVKRSVDPNMYMCVCVCVRSFFLDVNKQTVFYL